MDHVAIMSKSFGNLIAKILSREKKIESRWSKHKIAPWNRVRRDDKIYFKNAGEEVTATAEVEKVVQFDKLDKEKVREILEKWGGADGIAIASLEGTIEWAKDKKYCILIFLRNPKKVEPFRVNKKGFGTGAAWMCVEKIEKVKLA